MEDYTLGSLLGQFQVASVNVLMGQCYSGGFVDNLMRNGLVMATACRGDEQSWQSPDRPYDEFEVMIVRKKHHNMPHGLSSWGSNGRLPMPTAGRWVSGK